MTDEGSPLRHNVKDSTKLEASSLNQVDDEEPLFLLLLLLEPGLDSDGCGGGDDDALFVAMVAS